MQCCYAWNHRRQRWHTPSGVLLSFALPFAWRRRKKGNSPLYAAKTYLTSQAVLLHFLKHSWSLCNNFPTIALVRSDAIAFPFRPYTVCVLLMTKGNCTLKCIQLCVVIFFSWHIFTKKCSPDLIMDLHRDRIEGCIRIFVVWRLKQFLLHCSGIIWSKEECWDHPDLLFLFDWAFWKGKEKNVSPSLRGHLRHLWSGRKKLNCLVAGKTRPDQPCTLQKWIATQIKKILSTSLK